MYEYVCTRMHSRCMYAHNILKAKKDIVAGQEIFHMYGGPQWFASKNLPYIDIDYASTRWRPELQPLPCRKNVIQTTGADSRHSYTVLETVPSGTVLEISVCLEVSLIVVDQFPYLWDFVITGETENGYTICCQHTSSSSRPHTACVFADKYQGKVLHFIYPFTLFQCPYWGIRSIERESGGEESGSRTRNESKPSRSYVDLC